MKSLIKKLNKLKEIDELEIIKKEIDSLKSKALKSIGNSSDIFITKEKLLSDFEQILSTKTIARTKYYLNRLEKRDRKSTRLNSSHIP